MSKISDKINEVKNYPHDLAEITPDSLQEYKSNKLVKAACERYFEKIIEGVTDASFMVIAQKKLDIPEDDIDAFAILVKHKIIREDLSKKLKQAKGMRNILAHQYGKIDDELVFDSIKHELVKDVKDFLKVISNL